MDLYRYFHPHHNPRLRRVSMRLQEVGELEQAAIELRNAVRRAEVRTSYESTGNIRPEHFGELLVALDYIVESLGTLTRSHPGDGLETLMQLISERQNAPGWENWARLLKERLDQAQVCEFTEEIPDKPEKVASSG